jgi:tripartite-type tricarboxylate transporter receptor subunit TctC
MFAPLLTSPRCRGCRRGRDLTVAAFLAATLLPFAAHAQKSAIAYPERPIRVIALSSPGSGPDIVGRLIGGKLTEAFGQQVIVDTRPGASGIIGSEIAARAAPDGYTLVIITSQAVIVSQMYDKLKYDLKKDFTPITMVGTTPFLLVVHPSVAANSVKELIALVKSKPGQLRYGSGGSGSPPHLSFEILKSMTGMDIQHVPYKGVTAAMTDTIAGQVHALISVVPAVLPSVRGGRVTRARHHQRAALSSCAGHTADRGRRTGLRIHRLVQHLCTRTHAAADHHQAAQRDRQGGEIE